MFHSYGPPSTTRRRQLPEAKWNHGWFGGNENDEEMQRYISPYSHGELRLRLGNRVEETHLGVDNRPRIDNNRRLMSRWIRIFARFPREIERSSRANCRPSGGIQSLWSTSLVWAVNNNDEAKMKRFD